MADQAITTPFTESISPSELSQPHTAFQLRRTRNCKVPSRPGTKKSSSHRDTVSHIQLGSSIELEASGPHRSTSIVSLQSTMPSSTTSVNSGILSPKYTKTGRVSKAQKGVRGAHSCGCGKHYSRAEHLRRHQQNHETHLPCHFASCGKTFHRQDLLDRHIATKHNQQPANTPHQSSDASRTRSAYTPPGSVGPVATPIAPSLATPPFIAGIPSAIQDYGLILPQTSNDAQRYPQVFYDQSSTPFSYSAFPTVDVICATTQADATQIKAEHNRPIESAWPEPGLTFDPEGYARGHSPYPSSGGQSPDIPYPVSTPWNPMDYTYPTTFDHISIPYISTNFSSPRSNATAHLIPLIPDMDQAPFPTSVASSPTSVASTALPPVIISQNQKGVPYPLPFTVQRDRYGSLDLEGLLEDQHLGICLSLKTKQHYVESYWKYFHPMFPVIHKPSYQAQTPSPLLSAAVMSIGAQYNDDHFAKGDSRILHEKCQELITKYKSVLRSTTRIDYMQAVFLVEMFSHFKAKRATSQLSEIFSETYGQLWKQHGITLRSHLQSLATVKPHMSEEAIRQQWTEWIRLHSLERLLTACYILEAQQALLLARPNSTHTSYGLELYIPASAALWEAPVHTKWAQLIRVVTAPLTDVYQSLDNMSDNDNHVKRYEPFQCALLTACHASSVVSQRQDADNRAYAAAAASHSIFEASNIALLERFLCPQTNVLIAHNMVRLAAHSPTRALLAVSGESWVFSQRLSSEALLAAAEFETLKTQLRSWSETLQQPTLWPSSTGMRTDTHEALQRSLNIIRLALDMDSRSLAFGAEMALYYSSLVLWASTFTAVCKAEAAGLKFEDDDTAEFAAPRAERDARCFIQLAEADINSSTIRDGIPPADGVDRWRFGVGAVLTWSAWVIGGTGMRSSGAGELTEGAVGVLEKLGRRGWVGDWF